MHQDTRYGGAFILFLWSCRAFGDASYHRRSENSPLFFYLNSNALRSGIWEANSHKMRNYFDDEEEEDADPYDAWDMDRSDPEDDPDSDFGWGDD